MTAAEWIRSIGLLISKCKQSFCVHTLGEDLVKIEKGSSYRHLFAMVDASIAKKVKISLGVYYQNKARLNLAVRNHLFRFFLSVLNYDGTVLCILYWPVHIDVFLKIWFLGLIKPEEIILGKFSSFLGTVSSFFGCWL